MCVPTILKWDQMQILISYTEQAFALSVWWSVLQDGDISSQNYTANLVQSCGCSSFVADPITKQESITGLCLIWSLLKCFWSKNQAGIIIFFKKSKSTLSWSHCS